MHQRVLVVGAIVGLTVPCTRGQDSKVEEEPKQKVFPVQMSVAPDPRNGDANQRMVVTLTIEKGYHLLANPVGNDVLPPLTILRVKSHGEPEVVTIRYPKGELVKNPVVGDYRIYTGTVHLEVIVKRPRDDHHPLLIGVGVRPLDHRGCHWLPRTLASEIP